jgi:hypothetical protein
VFSFRGFLSFDFVHQCLVTGDEDWYADTWYGDKYSELVHRVLTVQHPYVVERLPPLS